MDSSSSARVTCLFHEFHSQASVGSIESTLSTKFHDFVHPKTGARRRAIGPDTPYTMPASWGEVEFISGLKFSAKSRAGRTISLEGAKDKLAAGSAAFFTVPETLYTYYGIPSTPDVEGTPFLRGSETQPQSSGIIQAPIEFESYVSYKPADLTLFEKETAVAPLM